MTAAFNYDDFTKNYNAAMAALAPLRARVSFKSFKEVKALSEETLCFSAVLVFDGKPVATATNRGHGGCTEIHFTHKEVEAEVIAIFKALAGEKPLVGFDSFIDEAVNQFAEEADWVKFAARWNKKGWTCLRIKGEGYGRINTRNAIEVADYAKKLTAKGKTITATL